MNGNLLDEQAFHVTERFFDAGTAVAQEMAPCLRQGAISYGEPGTL
jgi:hypothetical protein